MMAKLMIGRTIITTIDPRMYQFLVIRKAIQLYLETGMKVNRLYTPTNMMATATKFTDVPYRRGQLKLALDHMNQMYNEQIGV
jgi:hypothetical protein